MSLHVSTITIETHDPRVVADFWIGLLGYAEVDHPSSSIRIEDLDGNGPTILLQPGSANAAGTKNRIHLDLRPGDQANAVERALGLGATRHDVGQTGDETWVVLADPEGNEFCILQSEDDLKRSK